MHLETGRDLDVLGVLVQLFGSVNFPYPPLKVKWALCISSLSLVRAD